MTRPPIYLYESRRRRRRLREGIDKAKAWLWRYIAPGWLFVLMAICVLGILEVNATNAVLAQCRR